MSRANHLLQTLALAESQAIQQAGLVESVPAVAEDNEYQLAVALLQRFATEYGYKKATAALKKAYGAGITAAEGLADLEKFFTDKNNYGLAYVAGGVAAKSDEWRAQAMLALDNIPTKDIDGGIMPAIIRAALLGDDKERSLYKSRRYETRVLPAYKKILAKLPADFQTELRNDYGLEI